MESKLYARDLNLYYGDNHALKGINLDIEEKQITAFIGPSGCGKSTTLYLISGLESPTSGRIFFGDRDVTALPPEKRGIGLVFQNYALYPHLTVEQNIAFPLVNHKEGKEEIRRRTLEMARLVQIEDLLKRKPGQLSGVSDIISRCGGNVVSVHHNQSDTNMAITSCYLRVGMETRDHAQVEQIKQELAKAGFKLVANQQ